MSLTLTLKVTPAVRKYLLVHLGENYMLSETDPIGLNLYNLIRQPIHKAPVEKAKYEKWVQRHQTSIFEVKISSKRLFEEKCSNLSYTTHHKFNSLVEKILKQELHTFVENHREFGLGQHAAIQTIMAKYSLDDSDISFDALKKSFQRFRNRQIQKNLPRFCPSFSSKTTLDFVPSFRRQVA